MIESESKKRYNYIFSKLVESDNDLVGLVAYGIYKKHKIEFLLGFKEKHRREPDENECEVFFLTSTTETQLAKYKYEALNLISEIVSDTTSEEIRKAESEMLIDYQSKIGSVLDGKLPSNAKTFFIGLSGSLVGAFILGVLSVLFYIFGLTTDNANKALIENKAKNIQKSIIVVDSDSLKTQEQPVDRLQLK